ncbi:MAG: AIPR family protein [Oscillospiraceae bacterium]|nr:AIPR family protein [Oscillospiraceae bacterium]
MEKTKSYDFILQKISAFKETYPALRNKPDQYIFSALCVKSDFYKNPALIINEEDFDNIIVDSQYDGGVDILLNDPNSEGSDLVIGQSKFYKNISNEDVLNALLKMGLFYRDMINGHFEQVNNTVQSRFLTLNSEVGDESKIHFVFYTSALQKGINIDKIKKKFSEQFSDINNIEISILFGEDIEEDIKESEARRPKVESGHIVIDETNNYLEYGEEAVIVNVSAYSVKELYAQHFTDLLSRNLRYHIVGKDIDKAIAETINKDPDSFWFKNNGITIVCDDFEIDGKKVRLKNFSVVNGGQTTYMIHKNKNINKTDDLFLPCKIIKTLDETEDDKTKFSLEIAKATNSQKAIKPIDLKSNSPEQVRFAQTMREAGIFYQTKRGEEVPKQYRDKWRNSDLLEIGKLCLCAVFQLPCTSRSKPSSIYNEKYYNVIFDGNQSQIAKICKELLYIDNYYRTVFQKNSIKIIYLNQIPALEYHLHIMQEQFV